MDQARELGEEAVDLMRLIKSAIDPESLFNPGKLLPPLLQTPATSAQA
jgi:D-lactate dehydrogenase (cytochrome)